MVCLRKEVNPDNADFKVLKDAMAGKKQIQYLDSDLKKRLIAMCNDRLISINKEIDEIHSKTGMMNSLILELKQI